MAASTPDPARAAVAGAADANGGDRLQQTLRGAALRASERLGGGRSLVFSCDPLDPTEAPTLRAAAGFDTADEARNAANRLDAIVRETIASGQSASVDAELLELMPGDARSLPIRYAGRVHGAMIAGSQGSFGEEIWNNVGRLLEPIALHLDHGLLARRNEMLEGSLLDKSRDEDEKSDEILKLSEALFAQDIELLENNEKLGKVEKLKNDFIEKMSRELRTPLNSIIEAIISVLAGENEHLSEPAKESLRAALDDGTSFLRTLQNILDLWRIKQGELPVQAQEVNFREVIEEAIFSVQDALGDKQIEIERHTEEPLPKIRTDLTKVNQIVFLILENAVKFTDAGTVRIEARVEGADLVCEIQDTGIGICPDDREFVFDEFYQVDDSNTSRYRGAGLGLTLVRDLVALLEGELELESEVGVGTRVVVRIPVERAPGA